MRNIAIIPARSGSKGLKHKNIKDLNGKPLMAYTIEAAKQTGLFTEIMVSTDSKEYARIAREYGANVPFLRPPELATDASSSWDVVDHVIAEYLNNNQSFDTVALLQPTSPLRTSQDIMAGYGEMIKKDANLIVSVCEVEHSPLWSNVLPDSLSLVGFLRPDVTNVPRQNLPVYYRINGAIYIIKTSHLAANNLFDQTSYALIMKKERSIDIDDAFDFALAEVMLTHARKS